MAFYFSRPEKVRGRTGSNGWKAVGLNDLKPEDRAKLYCSVEWNGSYWVNESGSILLWIPDVEKEKKDLEKEKETDRREKEIDERLSKEGFVREDKKRKK